MKTKIFLVFVVGMLTTLVKAQTGSDYYLPLCVGNNTTLFCAEGPYGWGSRTTKYEILKMDLINGVEYFLEKGTEFDTYDVINPNHVFRQFWLRKDENGNVLMGAMDMDGSGDIANAWVINPPYILFPNEFLTVGYSRSYNDPDSENRVSTEEVLSVTETVGGYTNSIKIRDTRKTDGVVDRIQDAYYAKGVGRVLEIGIYPNERIHTDNFVSAVANTCNLGVHSVVGNLELPLVIYPNPSTGLFNVNNVSDGSTVEVYNLFGQKIMSQKNVSTFNLNGYPKGIYVVVLKNGNDVSSQKVFLE